MISHTVLHVHAKGERINLELDEQSLYATLDVRVGQDWQLHIFVNREDAAALKAAVKAFNLANIRTFVEERADQ